MFTGFNEPYEKFIKFDSNDRKMYELLALLHCINIKKGSLVKNLLIYGCIVRANQFYQLGKRFSSN